MYDDWPEKKRSDVHCDGHRFSVHFAAINDFVAPVYDLHAVLVGDDGYDGWSGVIRRGGAWRR